MFQVSPAPATTNMTSEVQRANVIAINDVGIDPKSELAQMLREADKDKDGCLDVAEITAVFQELGRKQSQVRMLSYMLMAQFTLLLLFAGVSFGLVWVVVEYHSNPVKNGIMIDKTTGAPIQVLRSTLYVLERLVLTAFKCLLQVESAVMTVNDGVLVTRNASNTSDSTVQVSMLETTNAELNSHWNTADLLQVKDIFLSDETLKGSFFSAKVTGVMRVFDEYDVGVVLFQTPLGRFILQGSNLIPAEDFEGGVLANVTASDIMNGRFGTFSNISGTSKFLNISSSREPRPHCLPIFLTPQPLTPLKCRSWQNKKYIQRSQGISQDARPIGGKVKPALHCAEDGQGRLLRRQIHRLP